LNFNSNNDKFYLGLGSFSIFGLFSTLLFNNENISITAQKDKNYDNKKNQKKNNATDLTTIKTKKN
jgi:hypothetical protein